MCVYTHAYTNTHTYKFHNHYAVCIKRVALTILQNEFGYKQLNTECHIMVTGLVLQLTKKFKNIINKIEIQLKKIILYVRILSIKKKCSLLIKNCCTTKIQFQ